MEIGVQRKHQAPIVNLSHPNETDVRERCRDVAVTVREFANRGSFFGETHPEPHRTGFDEG